MSNSVKKLSPADRERAVRLILEHEGEHPPILPRRMLARPFRK